MSAIPAISRRFVLQRRFFVHGVSCVLGADRLSTCSPAATAVFLVIDQK
jgi:hypothetical protein